MEEPMFGWDENSSPSSEDENKIMFNPKTGLYFTLEDGINRHDNFICYSIFDNGMDMSQPISDYDDTTPISSPLPQTPEQYDIG